MKGLPMSPFPSNLMLSRRKKNRTAIHHSFPFISVSLSSHNFHTLQILCISIFKLPNIRRSSTGSVFHTHNVNWCGRAVQSWLHSYGNFLHDTDTFWDSSKSNNSTWLSNENTTSGTSLLQKQKAGSLSEFNALGRFKERLFKWNFSACQKQQLMWSFCNMST